MKVVFQILLVLMTVVPGFQTSADAETRPRVLLISSWHPGFPTFFQQIEGIKSAFRDRQIVFDVEFMDSKRFPDNANIEHFCNWLSYKLSLTGKYDAVMTADDNALLFVRDYRSVLFPGVPVVFFGVNDVDRAVSLSADPNTTGVVEAVSMKETIGLMIALFPESRKIIAISDATPSGMGDFKTWQQLSAQFPGIEFSHISLAEISFGELPGILKKVPADVPVLLLSAYTDKNGRTLLFEESLKIIRDNLAAPVWHLWYHGIGDGLIGGKVISHYEQGKTAGEMVIRILDGTKPAEIPLVRESPNLCIFDHHELRRFGISLSDLPEDSRTLHLPRSLYREHRAMFWAFMGVFLCFSVLILIMVFHIRKRKQAESALRAHQEHLTEVVVKKTSELRESEERQRELLKGIPVPAYIWQKQGEHFVLADYNDAAYEVTKGGISGILGVNVLDFYADRPDIPADIKLCFEERKPVHREMEYVMKTTGIRKWLSVKYAFVRPNFVIVHADDITEHREITQKLSELLDLNQKMIQSSRLGIIAYNNSGKCILANEAAGKIVGAPPAKLMEHNFRHIASWQKIGMLEKAETALRTGKGQEIEVHTISTFGKEVWLAAFFSPFVSGGEPHLLLIIDDISERKKAEQALHNAKDDADRANKAKSAFLANMSHELRTPLNAVLGFSQLMARDSQISTEHREMLETIIGSGEHLLHLINDVLEMSRIEAGHMELEKENFDLIRTVDAVREMMVPRASEKGLELIVECDPDLPRYVCTDQMKLRQVLINLLNNAVKFTKEGGVTLRVKAEKSGSDAKNFPLVFEIEDTGPGITEEDRADLFNAFVQARSLEKNGEGTGLGLAISRSFVQLMGGDISVISSIGQGSVFRFHIQAEAATAKEQHLSKVPRRVTGLAPGQPEFRILIVEDRPESRVLLNRLLRSVGFAVREAVNGKEGVEMFEKWHPHLIWMDMRMPVMDGYAATRQIRTLPGGDGCIIIALTASAFEEQKNLVLSAGCDDFIRKPFRTEDIFEAMHRHIGVRYVYDDEPLHRTEKRKGADAANICRALAALSPEHLADLKKALVELDMEGIAAITGHIRTKNRKGADALAELADNFRFEQIMSFVSQLENSSQEESLE
ncbi:MAG: ABC transporter substrate binding protein [Desulfobacterales bacterium]